MYWHFTRRSLYNLFHFLAHFTIYKPTTLDLFLNTIRRISDQQEREIEVIADLDTTYLRVNCNDLESKTRLSNIFKAIVGKDITQKMYSMSEAFERGSKKMARREARHVNLSTL